MNVAYVAAGVGAGLGIGAAAAAFGRDSVNFSETHDMRRRPAPSTVLRGAGPLFGSLAVGGLGYAISGSANNMVAGLGIGALVGATGGWALGTIIGYNDSTYLPPGNRKLAPGWG